ncbi:hypothetical protein [Streptomyces triticiradicis]|uniref:Uncharacterized protein n=1 Tax=Streptomyces triticiradicis TaxID=2651189 RepID=A0A7J5D3P1_9ACTN|nr:hypothetical protein [Streptomyces triticiradicis]KAB1978619.1 hypothetical protein F8144_38810 [Streptomyces triticiradicis]
MTLLNWIQFTAACVVAALVSFLLTKFANLVLVLSYPEMSKRIATSFSALTRKEYVREHIIPDLRLSCRTFGVRFSIPGKKLNDMALEGYKASRGIPLFGGVSAFLLPIVAFVISTSLAAPFVREAYESEFHKLSDRNPFYVAIALYVFAVMWWPLELRRVRGVMSEAGDQRAFYECCRSVAMCLYVLEGSSQLLWVDRSVHASGRMLIRFGESEIRKGGITRQKELFEHAVRVKAALDECAGKALKEGNVALPELVAMLMKILERLSEGRLLCLLDESELPVYSPPSVAELEEETRKNDGRIVLWGATAAAVAAVAMISLGVPAGAVVPAALIFLMGPATLWGSKKIGNPRELLDAMRQGVSQPQDPQPSPGSASMSTLPSPGANAPSARTPGP